MISGSLFDWNRSQGINPVRIVSVSDLTWVFGVDENISEGDELKWGHFTTAHQFTPPLMGYTVQGEGTGICLLLEELKRLFTERRGRHNLRPFCRKRPCGGIADH